VQYKKSVFYVILLAFTTESEIPFSLNPN